jgi:membrane dipeptidase
MISRRKFIQNTAVSGASAFLFNDAISRALMPSKTSFHCFDLHAHPGKFFSKGVPGYAGDDTVVKTFREMIEARSSGAFMALVADAPLLELTPTGINATKLYQPGQGVKEYQRQINIAREFLKNLNIPIAIKAADFNGKLADAKPTLFMACEGGDFLEGKTDLLEQMYADGVRSMQLVHYAPSLLGDVQTNPPRFNGLSAAGKDVVKKLNQLKMVVDVAHASFETVRDTVAITDAPIMLSHSILAMDADRPISKRAISIEHAKAVASTGGIIGAWPSGFNKNFDEYGDNILRLVDAVGIDHVAIGTDMDGNFKPVLDSYLQMHELSELLQKKGLSSKEVSKIMDGNAKRVISKILS